MPQRKKVLYVIPEMSVGGAQRLIVDVCKELQKGDEYEPFLAVLHDEPNPYAKELEAVKVIQFDIPKHISIFDPKKEYLRPLSAFVEAEAPHIIHSHIYFSDLIINQLPYKNAAFFSHIHGITTQYDKSYIRQLPLKQRIIALAERRYMLRQYRKKGTVFLTVSNFFVEYLRRVLPELAHRVNLLQNSIWVNKIPPRESVAPPEMWKIVSVGRLEAVKGYDLAIEACAFLKQAEIQFHLDIYGDGSQRNQLQDIINRHQLSNLVNIHPFTPNVHTVYRNYHLYIHTAHSESFGLTILEAMAAGLPVICTDGGGNRDIVQHGINGFMVTDRTPSALADKILQLVRDPVCYMRFCEAARNTAKNFDFPNYINHLKSYYKKFT
ncbi:MAG: glycosyltransferase [Chitinophagales bacterium]|nr:glycosyltransferase [Chitinophagales bacterium]